jgi:hypothetical protein
MNCTQCIHLRTQERAVWCRKDVLDAILLGERQEGVSTSEAPFVIKRSWLKKNQEKLDVIAENCPFFEDDDGPE